MNCAANDDEDPGPRSDASVPRILSVLEDLITEKNYIRNSTRHGLSPRREFRFILPKLNSIQISKAKEVSSKNLCLNWQHTKNLKIYPK